MEVGDRENELPARLDPVPCILPVALGAMSIAAGVVGIVHESTLIALIDVASKGLGAAVYYVPHGSGVAREHSIGEELEVVRAIEPEDVCKLRCYFDPFGLRLQFDMSRFYGNGAYRFGGQMRATNVVCGFVSQSLLNGARPTVFQRKWHSWAKRVNGNLLFNAALTHDCLKGSLKARIR
jgi:hypothetical protein